MIIPIGIVHSVRITIAIAKVSLAEMLRDKILYSVLICALFLLVAGFLASGLVFIKPERVILDMGYASVSISSGAIALLMGSTLLSKEFERRTLYVILAHPVRKFQFIGGKFFGLVSLVTLNWFFLSLVYLGMLILSTTEGSPLITTTLLQGLLLVLVQSCLLGSIVIFFSSFSTVSLSVMMTVGVFLIGVNMKHLQWLMTTRRSAVGKVGLSVLSSALPHFDYFNWGLKLTYGVPVDRLEFLWTLAYGCSFSFVFLSLACFLIQGKEV